MWCLIVEFDAGAEGTKRVQDVAMGNREGGDRRDVGFDAGAEGTRRVQDVAMGNREGGDRQG
jgi:hypothetical protein